MRLPAKLPVLAREQWVAAGALVLLLLGCLLAASYALEMRSSAADELAERRQLLSRLASASSAGAAAGRQASAVAPPAAFIDAPTQGQAGAQLQSHLARLALEQQATVASSGVEPAAQEAPDTIRVQATLAISLDALQTLLHRLETGTPYLVVDSLSIQPSGAVARQADGAAPLRVTLILRGLWRRGAA